LPFSLFLLRVLIRQELHCTPENFGCYKALLLSALPNTKNKNKKAAESKVFAALHKTKTLETEIFLHMQLSNVKQNQIHVKFKCKLR